MTIDQPMRKIHQVPELPGHGQRILITGGRSPVALELTRLLHDAGHFVYAADSLEHYLCRSSNAVENAATLPAPRHHTQAFLAELERLVIQWRIDLLIPTCEEIFYVAQGLERLRPLCRVLCPKPEVLQRLHHKAAFIEWAAELGLPVPVTMLIKDEAAWIDAEACGSRPVFKPAYSRFASQVILPLKDAADPPTASRTWGARTRQAISTHLNQKKRRKSAISRVKALREVSASCPWVAQEFIEGQAWCTYSLVHEGKLLAHAAYACHYRTGQAGACVHFQQAEHPALLDWVKRFTAEIGYTGQISFDFIQAEDGTLYPIECNPRVTSGVHLFEPGDGLAEALTQPGLAALSGRIVMPRTGSAAMIKLAMLGSGFKYVRGARTWCRWMDDLRGARDVISRPEDSGPFTEQLRMMYSIWQRSRRLRMTVTQALTEDIEWNGERI